jgi:hypothetical protein
LVRERLKTEFELVERRYGVVLRCPDLSWLVIECWKLPPGWTVDETNLLLMISPGYPATPPDNFALESAVRLAGNGMPGNVTGTIEHAGRHWIQFSWHVLDGANGWTPHAEVEKGDNLLTFLLGVEARLAEAS